MSDFQSFDPTVLPLPSAHQLLLASIAPRPIAFASTISAEGEVNLSPFSFFNAFSTNPPVMIFSPSRSGRDNTTKDTYDNVHEIPEVVINMVTFQMVEQMSLASNAYPKGVNEFIKAGLTEISSERIRPPRVAESPVAFECTVKDVVPLGSQGGAGNLVICDVLLMHVHREYLDEKGHVDTTKLDLVGRMGGDWYCRASGPALFEVLKPGKALAIGIDQLPKHIRGSKVLSGNDLGKLGSLKSLPDNDLIIEMRSSPLYREAIQGGKLNPTTLHVKAKELVKEGQTFQALALLMTADFTGK